jgi:hypothetical protein
MPFDGVAGGAGTLAAVGFDIVQLFNDLESATIKDYQGIERDDLVEQQQRFDLWATNIGLHQRGHASLDYRFRDASTIYQYCQTLLEDLVKTLEICTYPTSSPVLEMPLVFNQVDTAFDDDCTRRSIQAP